MDSLILAVTWSLKRLAAWLRRHDRSVYRPPLPPKPAHRIQAARTHFYVVQDDGHLVPLGEALAALGLVGDEK